MMNWLYGKLRFVAIAFGVLLFVSVGVVSIRSIIEMSGNARIVNYAGIVRGGSQKLFKMETYAYYTDSDLDLEKRDKLTARLDNIIDCLINGGVVIADDKTLIQMHDDTFQEDMRLIRLSFDEIKEEIRLVREGKAPADLYSMTERYFDLCNTTVGDSEDFSQEQVNENIALLIVMNVLLLLLMISAGFVLFLANKNKHRAEELAKMAENAERESRAKSSFLANMSHEIRTPLNVITGMALIASRTDDTEKIRGSVGEIIKASDHLLSVVNDILDISKIESEKFELGSERFNLKQAIDEAGSMIQARCHDKDIHYTEEIDGGADVWVMGDKPHFKQVLINLLGNAVKFTSDEGKISLRVSTEICDGKLLCSASVADSGIGMTEEQMSKLFKSFRQADTNIALKYGGTGLGLAISRNIVRLMGGDIAVSSRPDKGSVFDFNVIFELAEQPESGAEMCEFPDLSGKRLLIVDDLEINRHIVISILEETNISIEEASDGSEAVEKMAKSPEGYYDIVFMDTRMPTMDGYEATRRIRALQRADVKTMPIISMSANAFSDDIKAAYASGMNNFLLKPVEIDKMAGILTRYLVNGGENNENEYYG
ncbi:MAG: response regulator [Oscillospiraceae bacterium]|jgi:signal transduction histidine kinase/CheY-like chemotaxis protein|nr:response regulator [Oscillospiraceae bacterium]